MTMPDMAGDEATRHIKHQFPEIHVIGLSMHDERDAAQQMLSAGAEAYLCKSGPPMDLLTVIRQTARQPSHR
jgi:DNA-binding NarL/FixJ family response regulator